MPPRIYQRLEGYSLDDLLTLAESQRLIRIQERTGAGFVVHFDARDVALRKDQTWKFICGILWGWVINGGQIPSAPSYSACPVPFVSMQAGPYTPARPSLMN